jgi:YgiT-type zinc finger domain-containing protein
MDANQKYPFRSPCEYCECKTHETVVKAVFWSRRGLVAVEDIPARVCEGCGEQSYDEQTARKMERAIRNPTVGMDERVRVPVFSLARGEVPKAETRREEPEVMGTGTVESTFARTEEGTRGEGNAPDAGESIVCRFCNAETYEDIVKSAFWLDRGLVAVEDIPARVCRECGEQFYDDETTRKIDALIENGFPPGQAKREIPAAVFSLVEVESASKNASPPG